MTSYVRALYDFAGEPNTSEISIVSGEILTVTRTDIGEGWWEGKNSHGQVGLFPAAYVEVMSAAEVAEQVNGPNQNIPSATAPPAPAAPQTQRYDQASEEWNDGQDDWEDDWDDDNDTYSEIGPSASSQNNNFAARQQNFVTTQQNNYASMHLPPTPSDDSISISGGAPATVRKSGMFSKSGDSYILGMVNVPVPESEKACVIQVDTGLYSWEPITQPYTVRVASPKKETKFKGMKSFIAYQLTPSFNNISVSRRYKHFDWLHERLVEKFCLIPIPPLPDKQISGRYEEQFIEHRRVQLQEFVDWMCRHPVLSKCEVWMHFLTCTDEKKWKSGKRSAEKDSLVGVTYCSAIFPPEKQLLQSFVDGQMESCSNFVHSMDGAVKNLLAIAAEQAKRHQMKKEFQRIGDGLADLSKSLEIDERRVPATSSLATSIGRTGGLFISIGQMYGEQPKLDWIPFSDRLHVYRGILGSFPDILSTHKGAMQKRKECERLAAEQKMGNAQLVEVGRRTDIISYAVLAEMTHFRTERDEHLKKTMSDFIDAQINFYQNIIVKLQGVLTAWLVFL